MNGKTFEKLTAIAPRRAHASELGFSEVSYDVFAGATVVVVDDVVDNIVLLKQLLRRAGVRQIHAFTDSARAVSHIPALDPDLVVLDLHMPGLDGFGVLEALKNEQSPGSFLPVLVLTADVSRETRRRALAVGAKDFLTKPIDADEALLRARNLLETRALHQAVCGRNVELQEQLDEVHERDRVETEERHRIHGRLDDVLAHGGPTMLFQPIVDLRTASVVGVEALARFTTDPYRTPDVWFEEAYQVGRGVELELSAIQAATDQLDDLPSGAFLSINASPATAVSTGLAGLLSTVPRERLVLELTEHTRVADYALLADTLAEHREAGLRLAIDDTGAGYASFQHLLRLRPDIIKLDITLTRHIDADPAKRALAVALASFSCEVGAVMIAEGVENDEELRVLRELSVTWGQGYHLGRPEPLRTT